MGLLFEWDRDKDAWLRRERNIGFEEVVFLIQDGESLLEILEHPNPSRYPGQRIFVVQRGDYVFLVPFIESATQIFLKTIIPSRKATRDYLGKGGEDAEDNET